MKNYTIKTLVAILLCSLAMHICGCCPEYKTSEMKFKTNDQSYEDMLQISSRDPLIPIAGNQEKIVYIDLDGNIVCFDCATNKERILVKAKPNADEYSSIVLDGNYVYYRDYRGSGLGWDTLYKVDIDTCHKHRVGRIYMDSPFYVHDGIVYSSETLMELLKNPKDQDAFSDDSYVYFEQARDFIVSNGYVYQQRFGRDNKDIIAFEIDSGERHIIPCSNHARLFSSNNNDVYYLEEKEFGEIKDGLMQKIIDVKDFNISYGYANVQIIGEYIIIGNGLDTHIYNKNTNSLEVDIVYGEGPYMVNGELIFRIVSECIIAQEDYFSKIGQGYYALNIEEAINVQRYFDYNMEVEFD